MTTILMNFGGTSVANIERTKNVASIIESKKKQDVRIVVVLSAMAGVTHD